MLAMKSHQLVFMYYSTTSLSKLQAWMTAPSSRIIQNCWQKVNHQIDFSSELQKLKVVGEIGKLKRNFQEIHHKLLSNIVVSNDSDAKGCKLMAVNTLDAIHLQ